MTARHAGSSRIADQALIDQVRAATKDLRGWMQQPSAEGDHLWLSRWAGRALCLLEQIGEMGE